MLSLYLAASSATLLTGFTSLAAETDKSIFLPKTGHAMYAEWDFSDIPQEIHTEILEKTENAAQEAQDAYLEKKEQERKQRLSSFNSTYGWSVPRWSMLRNI